MTGGRGATGTGTGSEVGCSSSAHSLHPFCACGLHAKAHVAVRVSSCCTANSRKVLPWHPFSPVLGEYVRTLLPCSRCQQDYRCQQD